MGRGWACRNVASFSKTHNSPAQPSIAQHSPPGQSEAGATQEDAEMLQSPAQAAAMALISSGKWSSFLQMHPGCFGAGRFSETIGGESTN